MFYYLITPDGASLVRGYPRPVPPGLQGHSHLLDALNSAAMRSNLALAAGLSQQRSARAESVLKARPPSEGEWAGLSGATAPEKRPKEKARRQVIPRARSISDSFGAPPARWHLRSVPKVFRAHAPAKAIFFRGGR
jgi:hypothetical protein